MFFWLMTITLNRPREEKGAESGWTSRVQMKKFCNRKQKKNFSVRSRRNEPRAKGGALQFAGTYVKFRESFKASRTKTSRRRKKCWYEWNERRKKEQVERETLSVAEKNSPSGGNQVEIPTTSHTLIEPISFLSFTTARNFHANFLFAACVFLFSSAPLVGRLSQNIQLQKKKAKESRKQSACYLDEETYRQLEWYWVRKMSCLGRSGWCWCG